MESALRKWSNDDRPDDGMHGMEVMNQTGDSKFQWDPNSPAEVAAAKTQFESLLAKGYQAFRVNARGEPGDRLHTWDAGAGQMIMTGRPVGG